MHWKADIIGFERVETPKIPVEAIREAVINSMGTDCIITIMYSLPIFINGLPGLRYRGKI